MAVPLPPRLWETASSDRAEPAALAQTIDRPDAPRLLLKQFSTPGLNTVWQDPRLQECIPHLRTTAFASVFAK